VLKVSKVSKDPQVQQEPKAYRATQDPLALKVSKDRLDPRVLRASKVRQATQVPKG
jgi:hypothetical protein